MNGYSMIAESYKKLSNQGKIDIKTAEKKIRILEFLSTCDNDDLCFLVDSSAFNDIIKGYIKIVTEEAGLDKTSQTKIAQQLNGLFDRIPSKEAMKKSE